MEIQIHRNIELQTQKTKGASQSKTKSNKNGNQYLFANTKRKEILTMCGTKKHRRYRKYSYYRQLKLETKEEKKEHKWANWKTTKRIAKDHLREKRNYYTKMKRCGL